MTVMEMITLITFAGGVFSAGFAVGRVFEQYKNDRR